MRHTNSNRIERDADSLQLAYDYLNQAWIKNGVYIRCGHPEAMNCGCYGKLHAGETPDPANTEVM